MIFNERWWNSYHYYENNCTVDVDIPEVCRTKFGPKTECIVKDLLAFNEIRVRNHNEIRRNFKDTPDLEFDLELACYAQERADAIAWNNFEPTSHYPLINGNGYRYPPSNFFVLG